MTTYLQSTSFIKIFSSLMVLFSLGAIGKSLPKVVIEQPLYLDEDNVDMALIADDSGLYDSLKMALIDAKEFSSSDLISDAEYYVGYDKDASIRIIYKSGSKQCYKHYNLYKGWAIMTKDKIYSSIRIASLGERVRRQLKKHGRKSKARISAIRDALISEWPSDWCDDNNPNMIDLILKSQKQRAIDSANAKP